MLLPRGVLLILSFINYECKGRYFHYIPYTNYQRGREIGLGCLWYGVAGRSSDVQLYATETNKGRRHSFIYILSSEEIHPYDEEVKHKLFSVLELFVNL